MVKADLASCSCCCRAVKASPLSLARTSAVLKFTNSSRTVAFVVQHGDGRGGDVGVRQTCLLYVSIPSNPLPELILQTHHQLTLSTHFQLLLSTHYPAILPGIGALLALSWLLGGRPSRLSNSTIQFLTSFLEVFFTSSSMLDRAWADATCPSRACGMGFGGRWGYG